MTTSVATSISGAWSPAMRRRASMAQDAALIVVTFVFFFAHGRYAIEAQSGTSVFFALEQGLLVGMFLFRRRSTTTSQRPRDWLVATIGGWGPLALRPAEAGGSLELTGVAIQCLGLVMVMVCFLALGRSFGVVAANRGLKVHGPYQFVRHPIYVSHAVTQVGFVLANPAWYNAAIFLVVTLFQCFRIHAEERVLSNTSDYAAYRSQVRWRLLPGVY